MVHNMHKLEHRASIYIYIFFFWQKEKRECLHCKTTLKLGEVSWLSDHPGSFVRNEGKKGETVFWSEYPYTDTIIPVLHHGAIGYGTDKCDLCRFYLDDGDCRRGARCTYAHGWHDRIE